MATPTWTESRTFLTEHRAALLAEPTLNLLAATDNDTARQHDAILSLTTQLPDEQVYALITDPGQAEDAALDAIETGNLPLLAAILTAAPSFQERPVTWSLSAAVLLLAQDETHQARQVAQHAAEQATPIQRRALTLRLRELATHHPDLAGLDILITDLTEPPLSADSFNPVKS